MDYSFIVAAILVIQVVAFIVWIAKKISAGERLDMKEGVVGVVILLVAVLIMVPMVSSTQVYMWDPDSGELTIQQNISGGAYAWDSYASDVKSLIIEDNVTVAAGAFDSLTSLGYVSIKDGVQISDSAFGVGFADAFGATVQVSPGSYIGLGDGTLYAIDPDIYAYNSARTGITGLASGATGAKYLVFPDGIQSIAASAFSSNATIEFAACTPSSKMTTIGTSAFEGCTSLGSFVLQDGLTTLGSKAFKGCVSITEAVLPDSLSVVPDDVFNGCTSLASAKLPSACTKIGNGSFRSTAITSIDIPSTVAIIGISGFAACASLTSATLPSGVVTLYQYAFNGCSSLTEFYLPATLDRIDQGAFNACTGATSVTFAAGFNPTTFNASWTSAWTFYASDGTTVIDKTVAANLAGKTFQGTAAALVEVSPGLLSLTPDQLQQVQLHDAELQDLKDHLTIDPLPFQPSLQTEQEQVAA